MGELLLIAYVIFLLIIVMIYRKNLFHPIPILYAYWFITFPFKYFFYEYYPEYAVGGYINDIEIRNEALAWSLAYITVVLVFYPFLVLVFNRKKPVNRPSSLISVQAVKVVWIISGTIFISFNMEKIISGDIVAYLSNRNETYSGDGFFKVFGSTFFFMSTVAMLASAYINFYKKQTPSALKKMHLWTVVAIFVGILFLILEMVRGKLLIIISAIFFLRHFYIKRMSIMTISSCALAAIFIIGALSQVKYVLVTGTFFSIGEFGILDRVIGGVLVSFDSMDHLNQVILKKTDIVVSETLIQPFLDPVIANVPRVIWEGKPTSLGGISLQEYIYPELTTESGVVKSYYSVSAVGEALLLGGWVGIIIFGFYLAVVLKIFSRSGSMDPVSIMFTIVLVMSLFNVCRAGIFGLNSVLMNFLLFWVFYSFIKMFLLSFRGSPKEVTA